MNYAQAKGNGLQIEQGATAAPRRRPPEPIESQAEHDRIAANFALVKQHMPEFVPFIKDAHEAGMIDGLRAIEKVEVLPRKEP